MRNNTHEYQLTVYSQDGVYVAVLGIGAGFRGGETNSVFLFCTSHGFRPAQSVLTDPFSLACTRHAPAALSEMCAGGTNAQVRFKCHHHTAIALWSSYGPALLPKTLRICPCRTSPVGVVAALSLIRTNAAHRQAQVALPVSRNPTPELSSYLNLLQQAVVVPGL